MNKYQVQLLKQFESFIKDDSISDPYDIYEFPDNYALLRVFTYNPDIDEKSGLYLDMISSDKTSSEAEFRLITVGKILASTKSETEWYNNLKPGDMVSIADELSGVQINPKWVEFQELMKERPAPSAQYEPPQLLGKIQAWSRYAFVGNKLKEDRDEADFYTFLIPHSFISSKIKKDGLIKLAKEMAKDEAVEMATSNKS